MVAKGIAGVGTQLQMRTATGPDVWTVIDGAGDLSGPGMTRSIIDVTSLDSTAGFMEKITGLADGGTLSCDLNYRPGNASQQALLDAFTTNAIDPNTFRVVLQRTPLHDTYTFDAYITSLSLAIPVNDKVTRSLELTITGPVVKTDDNS